MENKSVDVGMLIRESNILYKNDLIANRKDAYAPGDTIELYFPRGDYVANLAKSKIAFRPVIKTDVPSACVQLNDEKSWAHIQYIKFDQKDVIPAQGDRSRPVFNAFKERLVDADKQRQDPMRGFDSDKEYQFIQSGSTDADANAAANSHFLSGAKWVGSANNANILSVERVNDDFDINKQTYRNVYRRRVRFAQRFGKFSTVAIGAGLPGSVYSYDQLDDPADSSVTYQAGERQTFFEIALGDLITEFATMNQIYMGQFADGIRVSIRLVEPKYALSLVIPQKPHQNTAQDTNLDTFFKMSALMSYRITDLYIALRKHELNPEGQKLMQQMSVQVPIPYVTYQYQLRSLDSATLLLDTTTLNAKNYLGTIILFTGQGPAISQLLGVGANAQVNYRGNTIHQEPVNQYNSDHFFLEFSRAQVEVGNLIYKMNTPPIPNRDKASYLAAVDCAEIMFNGKQYALDFQEFIDRGMAIFIPTNSMGSRGIDIRGLRLTTTVEFANPQSTGKTITNYQAHIFHIVTASVRFDQTSGVLVE